VSKPGSGREGLTFKLEIDLGSFYMRTSRQLAEALLAVAKRVRETCDSEIDNTEAPRNIVDSAQVNTVGWWAVIEETDVSDEQVTNLGDQAEKVAAVVRAKQLVIAAVRVWAKSECSTTAADAVLAALAAYDDAVERGAKS
jgi:hypothetical protein